MQQVAAANNKFLSSANLIFAAGDNYSWIFTTPGQKQFGTAVGKVLAQRSAELAIAQRCAIATLSLAQRSAATTISTIAAQRSVCVNVP